MRTSHLLVVLICVVLSVATVVDVHNTVGELTGPWLLVFVLSRPLESIAMFVRLASGPYWYVVALIALMLALAAHRVRRRRG